MLSLRIVKIWMILKTKKMFDYFKINSLFFLSRFVLCFFSFTFFALNIPTPPFFVCVPACTLTKRFVLFEIQVDLDKYKRLKKMAFSFFVDVGHIYVWVGFHFFPNAIKNYQNLFWSLNETLLFFFNKYPNERQSFLFF